MPRNDSLVDRITTAAAFGSPLPDYTRKLGIELKPIADAVGIDIAQFDRFSARVSLNRMCRLFEALATLSDDAEFGLNLAKASSGGVTGAYAYGLISAPTLLDALRFTERHIGMVIDMQRFSVTYGPERTRFEWRYSPLIVSGSQFSDYFTALYAIRLRHIAGPALRAARYEMVRAKPRRVPAYRDMLSPIVSFGCDINAIELPSALLSATNPTGDPRLFKVMDEQCLSLTPPSSPEDDPIDALRLHIADTLETETVTLESAAAYLGLSSRTLQRRLAENGTNLNELIDTTRSALARKMLEETDLSIQEIGFRLGFSQQSAFTRSAKRWFSTTPSTVRKRVKTVEARDF